MPSPKASYLNSLPDPLYPPKFSIIPRTGPVCFEDGGTESGTGKELFMADDNLLPQTALKITYWGDEASVIFIYDTRDKTIITWRDYEDNAVLRYDEQPRKPAVQVINRWIGKLESLEWIPWIVDEWRTIDQLSSVSEFAISQAVLNNSGNPITASLVEEPPDRDFNNWFNSMRVIYEACGWPDRSLFDREKFLQMRNKWHEGQLEVLKDMWHANPDSAGGVEPHPSYMELSFRYMEVDAVPLREYLRQTAGQYAI